MFDWLLICLVQDCQQFYRLKVEVSLQQTYLTPLRFTIFMHDDD